MSVTVTDTALSTRPYLLRGFYEWIGDNGWTPYIVVDAFVDSVSVPQEHVDKDGKIILNISMIAVTALQLGNVAIEFEARFSGMPMQIYVPIVAIEAIYARENGRGIVFTEEEEGAPPPSPGTPAPVAVTKKTAPTKVKNPPKKPSLKLVK